MKKLTMMILGLAMLAGSALATDFPLIVRDSNGFDTTDLVGKAVVRSDGPTTMALALDFITSNTVKFNGTGNGAGTAGYIWTAQNTTGRGKWIAPASVVPPALVGNPIIINGIGTWTPQIQARLTGANQIPFYSTHLATDYAGAFDLMGCYRGTLGAMSFLQNGDPIRRISGVFPNDATEWTARTEISFYASGAHSAGVYPTDIGISAVEGSVNILGSVSANLSAATIGLTGDITATDDLTVDGFTTLGDRAVITAGVPPGTAPTLTINEASAGQAAGTRAIQVNNSAAAEKFYVDLDGNCDVGGNLGCVGNFDVDSPSQATFGGAVQLGSGAGDDIDLNGTITTNVIIGTAGKGINVKEGTNARQGLATLVAGTVVVNTTAVSANSRIFLTAQEAGLFTGSLRVSARTAGTSFTILSTVLTDTADVAWEIFDPA